MRKALVQVKNQTFRETPYFGPVYYIVEVCIIVLSSILVLKMHLLSSTTEGHILVKYFNTVTSSDKD